jgi:hypothetical protein
MVQTSRSSKGNVGPLLSTVINTAEERFSELRQSIKDSEEPSCPSAPVAAVNRSCVSRKCRTAVEARWSGRVNQTRHWLPAHLGRQAL